MLVRCKGDDIFLEALPAAHRSDLPRLDPRQRCRRIDGFIATSRYYADFMAGYLGIARAKIHVVHPGSEPAGHGERPVRERTDPFTIGYFARICPEKGLHDLVEAFSRLRQDAAAPPCRLHASGWLGDNNRPYFDEQRRKLAAAGLAGEFTHVECPTHDDKVRFLHAIDVLSVPTTYREPKGLYVLEALANGVPVVQPRHGSFPELIEATGGGLLVSPNDADGPGRCIAANARR